MPIHHMRSPRILDFDFLWGGGVQVDIWVNLCGEWVGMEWPIGLVISLYMHIFLITAAFSQYMYEELETNGACCIGQFNIYDSFKGPQLSSFCP